MASSDYEAVETSDGSFTCFSKQYDQCYHSTNDGAFNEALNKHVRPAFEQCKEQEHLAILDICFGLGINTLTALWYNDQNQKPKKLSIYSPELDAELLQRLKELPYPKELHPYLPILFQVIEEGSYKDDRVSVELFIGDAREYIKRFDRELDIVFQDAFSPDANPMLWTKEYFADIKKGMKQSGILTSYSTALKTRLALYENGFYVYLLKGDAYHFRNATLATLQPEPSFEAVDMEHKIACNPGVKPLSDRD